MGSRIRRVRQDRVAVLWLVTRGDGVGTHQRVALIRMAEAVGRGEETCSVGEGTSSVKWLIGVYVNVEVSAGREGSVIDGNPSAGCYIINGRNEAI